MHRILLLVGLLLLGSVSITSAQSWTVRPTGCIRHTVDDCPRALGETRRELPPREDTRMGHSGAHADERVWIVIIIVLFGFAIAL